MDIRGNRLRAKKEKGTRDMDSNQTGEGKAGALSQVQEFALREMKHRFAFRYLWRQT